MKTLSRYVLSIVVAMLLVVIANVAFASKMTLPSNLQLIESQAFYQDESIDEVVLPDGIERIESQAFAYSNLSRINLPSSLTYIDSSAFEGCWDTLFTGEENTYASSFCAYMGYPYVTYDVPVEEIRLQTDYIQMKVGETYNIITTVLPSNASQKKLNYYASDSGLSVTDTGTIYANEPGWSVVSIQTTDGSLRCVYLYVEIVDDLSISATADTRSIICNVTKPGGTIYIEGGVAPYSISYTWHADGYQNPQQVHWIDNINTDTVRWTCDPCNNHEGSFHVNITCTDSAGQTKTYTINGFNMRVDSTCTVSPAKAKVFTGERMTNGFKVTINGNYGPYYLSLRIMKNNVTYDEITIDNVASQYTWIPDALSDAGTYELYCYCSDETTGGSGRYIATLEVVVPVSSITLGKTSHTLNVGNTYTLSSSVSPSSAANKTLRWTSSNTSVATVSSSGVITAKAPGTATIKAIATDGSNVNASCTVTVKQPVTGISLSSNHSTLYLGSSLTTCNLTTSVSPSNATNKSVTWTSSNTSIATVNSSGKVTAVAAGTATITATAADGSGVKGTYKITVANYTAMTVNFGYIYVATETAGYMCEIRSPVRPNVYAGDLFLWDVDVSGGVKPYQMRYVIRSQIGLADLYDTGFVSYDCSEWVVPAGMPNSYQLYVEVKDATGSIVTLGDTLTSYMNWRIQCYPIPTSVTKYVEMKVGETYYISTGILNTVDYRTITNSNSAVVSNDGITLTANKTGTSTIKIMSDRFGVTETYYVTVLANKTTVSMSSTEIDLSVNGTKTLSASVSSAHSTSAGVTWKSSNTSVATVSSSGLVTGKGAGTAIITATANDGSGVAATCAVTVFTKPSVLSISYPISATMATTNYTVDAQIAGGKGPYTCLWTLYKGSVLTDSLTVSSVTTPSVSWNIGSFSSTGSYYVALKVTDAFGNSATQQTDLISVSSPSVKMTKITMSSSLSMKIGATSTLSTTIAPSNASNKTINWTSSNTAVATVNSSGVVTAKAAGSATITATAADGSGTKATCSVSVASKPTITFTSQPTAVTPSDYVTVSAKFSGGKAPYTVYWALFTNDVCSLQLMGYQNTTGTDSLDVGRLDVGTYKAELIVEDALGQTVTAYTKNIVSSNPAVGISSVSVPSSISSGSKLGTVAVYATGGELPINAKIEILNSSGTRLTQENISSNSRSLSYSPAYVFTTSGTYKVKVTLTDAAGSSATKTVSFTVTGGQVTQGPTPGISVGENGAVTFSWDGVPNAVEYDLYIFPGSVYPSDSTWSKHMSVEYLSADARNKTLSFSDGTYYVWMSAVGSGGSSWKYGNPVKFHVGKSSSEVKNTAEEIVEYALSFRGQNLRSRFGDEDWCTLFVHYCANYVNNESISRNGFVTGMLREMLDDDYQFILVRDKLWEKSKYCNPTSDEYIINKNYIPQKGDLVFIDNGNHYDGPDHIGFVVSATDALNIVTVEGNSSNKVSVNTYKNGDYGSIPMYIWGYVRPTYDQ